MSRNCKKRLGIDYLARHGILSQPVGGTDLLAWSNHRRRSTHRRTAMTCTSMSRMWHGRGQRCCCQYHGCGPSFYPCHAPHHLGSIQCTPPLRCRQRNERPRLHCGRNCVRPSRCGHIHESKTPLRCNQRCQTKFDLNLHRTSEWPRLLFRNPFGGKPRVHRSYRNDRRRLCPTGHCEESPTDPCSWIHR